MASPEGTNTHQTYSQGKGTPQTVS